MTAPMPNLPSRQQRRTMLSPLLSIATSILMLTFDDVVNIVQAIPHGAFMGGDGTAEDGSSGITSSTDGMIPLTNPSLRDDFGGPFFDPTFFDPLPTESITVNTPATKAPTKAPSKTPSTNPPTHDKLPTIAEIACSTEGFETLCELVVKTGLDTALGDKSASFTVFAPTNEAFEEISDSILAGLTKKEIEFVLLYHATDGKILAKDLVCEKDLLMVNGLFTTIKCKKDGSVLVVGTGNMPLDAPRIIKKNIKAKNGVIHVVDKVILPDTLEPPVPTKAPTHAPTKTPTYEPTKAPVFGKPTPKPVSTPSPTKAPVPPPTKAPTTEKPTSSPTEKPTEAPTEAPTVYVPKCKSVAGLVCQTQGLEILCKLLKSTGLDHALGNPYENFTLFAPTNEAFEKLKDAFAKLTPEEAAYALLYHVINDLLFSYDLTCAPKEGSHIEMANGMITRTECSKDGRTFQVGTGNTGKYWPRIIAVDMQACNGVVHAVNDVILPGAAPKPPTYKPTPSPTYKPVPPPTYKPVPPPVYPQPVPPPRPMPVHPPTIEPISGRGPEVTGPKDPTHTARYDALWGASAESCGFFSPNVFLNCEGGGVINVETAANAICRRLSDDFIQCRQPDSEQEAFVTFTCSGMEKGQLKAEANIGPSPAWECKSGGAAIKYITLSRYCFAEDGRPFTVTGDCVDSDVWVQENEVESCAVGAMCLEQNCEKLGLSGVTTTHINIDDRPNCSFINDNMDFNGHIFKPSSLSSLNLVDWRFSGQGRGCMWEPPALSLRCEEGGEIDFLEEYPFCRKVPEDNMAICENFAPFSTNAEEVLGLLVTCTGKNEDQLILTVEVPSSPLDVDCARDGVAMQSISLGRACGEYETDEFRFVNDPFFCTNEDQIFQIDSFRSHCFAGDSCSLEGGCDSIQLPTISANTDQDVVGYCIYAV